MKYKVLWLPEAICGGLRCVLTGLSPTHTTTQLWRTIYTKSFIQTSWDIMWYNSSGFWEAVMRTDSPYHPSRYWEPHIQTCWEFNHTLYNAIQRVWIALVDFWAAGVCTDGTPTPTLPPIQILGTIYPNLLRLSAHVIWCYTMCLDHPSWFLRCRGEYWWHPHPDPTTHPDAGKY